MNLYLKAGKLGSGDAHDRLASNYEQGVGTAKDEARAREFRRKADALGRSEPVVMTGGVPELPTSQFLQIDAPQRLGGDPPSGPAKPALPPAQ